MKRVGINDRRFTSGRFRSHQAAATALLLDCDGVLENEAMHDLAGLIFGVDPLP